MMRSAKPSRCRWLPVVALLVVLGAGPFPVSESAAAPVPSQTCRVDPSSDCADPVEAEGASGGVEVAVFGVILLIYVFIAYLVKSKD